MGKLFNIYSRQLEIFFHKDESSWVRREESSIELTLTGWDIFYFKLLIALACYAPQVALASKLSQKVEEF